MQPEDRTQKHPQGVRRCVPRCCAATLPQTEDRIVVVSAPRHLYDRAALLHTKPQSSERGSTLIISLIILIIMMLLGVMAMNTSDTQYKLAGNLQFENMAMNNAEVAIDAAERWLETDVAAHRTVAANTGTLITPSADNASGIDPFAMAWTNADSFQVVAGDDRQRYVIGFVSTNLVPTAGLGADCIGPSSTSYKSNDCVNTYLITARGQGGRGATKLVQVYYAVPHT